MSKEIDNIEKLMNQKSVEFREFKLTNIETRQEDEKEKLIVEGVPCVFNSETVLFKTDDYEAREIIDKLAFQDTDMSDVIFNFNHGGRVFARTRNNSLALSVQNDGLHMKAELWADDRGHEELYRDIKRGNIDKMSFAFTVKNSEYTSQGDEATGKELFIRTIKAIDKLYDVSAVDIPAYNATEISARNVFQAESEKNKLEKDILEKNERALKIEKDMLLEKINFDMEEK